MPPIMGRDAARWSTRAPGTGHRRDHDPDAWPPAWPWPWRAPGPLAPAPASARAAADTQRASFRLTKIDHVWIIELENESSSATFGDPSPTRNSPGFWCPGRAAHELLRHRPRQPGQLHRPDLRPGADVQTGQDCSYFSKFLQFGGENFGKWTRTASCPGRLRLPEVHAEHRLPAERARPELKSYNQQMATTRPDGTTATAHGPACGTRSWARSTSPTSPARRMTAMRPGTTRSSTSRTSSKPGYCDSHVVTLKPLTADLTRASTTPDYSSITPNTCATPATPALPARPHT